MLSRLFLWRNIMADVQHATLSDDRLHYPKGAATAANNTWMKSNGDGTTTFETLPTPPIYTLAVQDQVSSSSSATQWLAATGDQAQLIFNTTPTTSPNGNITVGSDGSITFNNSGIYEVVVSAIAGRDTASGTGIIHFSGRLNGVTLGRTYTKSLASSTDVSSALSNTFVFPITAGDVLTFHMLRTGSASGNVGVVTMSVGGATGWNDAASTSVTVFKLGNNI